VYSNKLDVMDSVFTTPVILAIVVIVVAVGLLALREGRRRRGALAAWANERGWTLTEKGPDLSEGRKGFPFRHSLDFVHRLATGEHNGVAARLYLQEFSSSSDSTERSRWLYVSLTLPHATPSVSFIRHRASDGASLPVSPAPEGYHSLASTPLGEDWTVIVEDGGDSFARQLLDAGIGQLLASERMQQLTNVPIIVFSGSEVSLVTNDRMSFDFVDPTLSLLEELAAVSADGE